MQYIRYYFLINIIKQNMFTQSLYSLLCLFFFASASTARKLELDGTGSYGTIEFTATVEPDWRNVEIDIKGQDEYTFIGFEGQYHSVSTQYNIGGFVSTYVSAEYGNPTITKTDPFLITATASYDTAMKYSTFLATYLITADGTDYKSGVYTLSLPTPSATSPATMTGSAANGTLSWIATFYPNLRNVQLNMKPVNTDCSFVGYNAQLGPLATSAWGGVEPSSAYLFFGDLEVISETLLVTVTGAYDYTSTETPVEVSVILSQDTSLGRSICTVTLPTTATPQITGAYANGTMTWVAEIMPSWSEAEFFLSADPNFNFVGFSAEYLSVSTQYAIGGYDASSLSVKYGNPASLKRSPLCITATATYVEDLPVSTYDASYSITVDTYTSTDGNYIFSMPFPTATHTPEITGSAVNGTLSWVATFYPSLRFAEVGMTSIGPVDYSFVGYSSSIGSNSVTAEPNFYTMGTQAELIFHSNIIDKTDPLIVTITGAYDRTQTNLPIEAAINLSVDDHSYSSNFDISVPTTSFPEVTGVFNSNTLSWVATIYPE